MAKKKGRPKGAAKKSIPRRAPTGRTPAPTPPWTHETTMPAFSLADEVRWMANHRSSAFDASKQLRHHSIQFVSAGCLQGTIKEQIPPVQPTTSSSPASNTSPASPSPSPCPSASPANMDAMAHLMIRSPSPSSEDEVIFMGRGKTQLLSSGPSGPTKTAISGSEQPAPQREASCIPTTVAAAPSRKLVTQNLALEKDALREGASSGTPQLTTASSGEHEQVSLRTDLSVQATTDISVRIKAPQTPVTPQIGTDSDEESVVDTQFEKRRGGKQKWEGQTVEWVSRSKPGIGWLPVKDRPGMEALLREEANPLDAAMEDYMQNVDQFGLEDDMVAASGFASREMDLDAGSHNDWQPSSPNTQEHYEDWDSDMLHDLDGLSTSSDVADTVVRVISKRTRNSGVQYLCTYEGATADDGHWLPAAFLNSAAERKLIDDFEAEMLSRRRRVGSDTDSDSELSENGKESTEKDEELDDEAIARILQKQEELGLQSDEAVLFGSDEYFWNAIDAPVDSRGFQRPNKKRQQSSRGMNYSKPGFPSASAMVDALTMDPYGGFDIMDTERPSLRPRKKGRRGQMPPELEDEDLNAQMQATWAADRAKKRLKKAEREDLRRQGLLGRKGKAPDLSVKYKDGIDMQEVVEEIREFLMSEVQILSLPPMEAERRATIHQFAGFINLTSRSRGDGFGRFTVLSKTSRTKRLSDDEFDAVLSRKGFKNRLRGSTRTNHAKRGPVSRPIVSYKEGETVGAHAPELGPENRGRAMLEKMGWSKGMALGAVDNKGILHPIAHTVKTTKAGLQ